jgi:hypothetical protein
MVRLRHSLRLARELSFPVVLNRTHQITGVDFDQIGLPDFSVLMAEKRKARLAAVVSFHSP